MRIEQVLRQPEGRLLEFKREIPKNRLNLLKTAVAFANGAGGSVYVGVDDDRNVIGINEEPFDLEERVSNMLYDSIAPIPNVVFQTAAFENKIIFVIRVLPGPNKPYYLKKIGPESGVFVRVGSTNRTADSHVLAELKRQARNLSFDQEVDPSFDCHILDQGCLARLIECKGLDIAPTLDYFVKIKAAQRYDHVCHPTIGGILMFCSTLPDPYSNAAFRVSRFKTENRAELIRSITIDDGLLTMPEKVMDFVRLYLEKNMEISGLLRKETYDIPLIAVREAVLNAICHRNYGMWGSVNKLDIFSDRIEITSPGTLPIGITLQDLGEGISESRNRYIVKIFREAGYIEQLGTGIMRIRDACTKMGCPQPEFREVGEFFKATLFKAKSTMPVELSAVYDLLKNEGELGSQEMAEKLGVHRNTVLKRLKLLEAKGLVHKKGTGPRVKYSV